MLFSFLYHRINDEKYGNKEEMLSEHFNYLKKYNIVFPGEKINPLKTNICITFDDGYFDFYHFIFPILKKLRIKAQLAVIVKYIENTTSLSSSQRLKGNCFCTWIELKEMAQSGLVKITNHSYSHKDLTKHNIDLNLELLQSKYILEKKLNKKIDTLVYPLGKFNEKIHDLAKKHYKYIMRIGSTFNLSWKNTNNLIYRIISDNLKKKDEKLKITKYPSYLWFYFLNTFRKR